MKIIHCADIHLDSKMSANLTKEKARERKTELLTTFQNMVAYGAEQGVATDSFWLSAINPIQTFSRIIWTQTK